MIIIIIVVILIIIVVIIIIIVVVSLIHHCAVPTGRNPAATASERACYLYQRVCNIMWLLYMYGKGTPAPQNTSHRHYANVAGGPIVLALWCLQP